MQNLSLQSLGQLLYLELDMYESLEEKIVRLRKEADAYRHEAKRNLGNLFKVSAGTSNGMTEAVIDNTINAAVTEIHIRLLADNQTKVY